jgi:hypothetical protein
MDHLTCFGIAMRAGCAVIHRSRGDARQVQAGCQRMSGRHTGVDRESTDMSPILRSMLLSIAFVANATPAQAVDAEAGTDPPPTVGLMGKGTTRWVEVQAKIIEADLTMPAGAAPLDAYTRYYAYEPSSDSIVAVFLRGGEIGAKVVPRDALPMVLDGGCDVVRLRYSVAERQVIMIGCSGVASIRPPGAANPRAPQPLDLEVNAAIRAARDAIVDDPYEHQRAARMRALTDLLVRLDQAQIESIDDRAVDAIASILQIDGETGAFFGGRALTAIACRSTRQLPVLRQALERVEPIRYDPSDAIVFAPPGSAYVEISDAIQRIEQTTPCPPSR